MKSSSTSEETSTEVTKKLHAILATVKRALREIREDSHTEKVNYIQRISLNLEYNKL